MASQHFDLDEQEQLDRIKDFWKRYGNFITWVLIVALAVLGSWMGYKQWQVRKATEASVLFGAFEQALQEGDETRFKRALEDLGKSYPTTTYTQQAHLQVAKFRFDKGDLSGAKQELQYVVDNAPDEGYQAIARLRLSGVLVELKDLDAALQVLAAEIPASFAYLVTDRQGDIYALKGNWQEAKKAYEKAYQLADDTSSYRPMIEVKMRALGVEPPSPQPTASQAKSG